MKNSVETAMVMVAVIKGLYIKHKMTRDINDPKNEFSAAQQYNKQKGLRKFGEHGEQALVKEMSQQHKRECFVPRHRKSLSVEELKKAQEAITFLTEKRDGEVKGRTVYNGKPYITESQRENG